MPTASAADWLIVLAAVLGVLLFGGAAWWALYADRARNRRRCPRCWFDLTYTGGRRCTECGHVSRSEAELRRTRRKPVIGILAIVGCAILGARGLDHLINGGWGMYAPTSLLVAVLDHGGMGHDEAGAELRRRIADGAVDAATLMSVLEGAADGSSVAPVGSDAWVGRHGPWVQLALAGLVALDDGPRTRAAREIVLDLANRYPPDIELEPPVRWPAERPVPVGVVVRERWNVGLPVRLVVEPPRGRPVAFARFGPAIQQRSFTVELPPLEAGRHPIDIDFRMSRCLDAGDPWQGDALTGARTVLTIVNDVGETAAETGAETPGTAAAATPARTADTAAETAPPADESPAAPSGIPAFPPSAGPVVAPSSPPAFAGPIVPEPVSDPAIGMAISRVFDRGAVQWADGSLPVRLTVDRRSTALPSLDGVAIGIEVEVRRNGDLGRTLELWWMGGRIPTRPNEWEVPFVDDEVLLPPTSDDDRWELVIRSREDLALRVPGARIRWEGQVTRPLAVQRRSGLAPSRGWIRVSLPEASVRSGNDDPGRPRLPSDARPVDDVAGSAGST